MPRRSSVWIVSALVLLCFRLGSSAQSPPAQTDHRVGFRSASDEVFDVLREFYAYDEDWPLDARVVETWETAAARVERLVYTTSTGERVPGELHLPRHAAAPFPCVLLVHGLGSDRERWWQDDRVALPDGLLAKGIAVFAIDLRFHGQRAAANDYESPVYLTLGNRFFVRSRDMLIQSAIDCRRALALLRLRDDIDKSRIGITGYSMGGMIAIILAGLDEPLAAVVACAVPSMEQPAPIDPYHFAPRAHAPTLLLIGRDDWLSSPADMQQLVELLPTGDHRLRFFDGGHRLPPAFLNAALDWLTPRLVSTPD